MHKKNQQKFFALHNKSLCPNLTLWQGTNFSLLLAIGTGEFRALGRAPRQGAR
jgi:hypothetical protein